MKIDPKFVIKVAGTLTVIALVTAALLGLVDGVTRGPIAAIEAEKTRVAMSAVAPAGSEFTDKLEIPAEAVEAAAAQGGKVMELYGVKAGGYVMKISASGSQWSATLRLPVSAPRSWATSPTTPALAFWTSSSACPVLAAWWSRRTSFPSPPPPSPPRASPWALTPLWLPRKLWAKKGGPSI